MAKRREIPAYQIKERQEIADIVAKTGMCEDSARQIVCPDSEQYLVAAIKTHLLTPTQKKMLSGFDLSVEDCLNGRYGEKENDCIELMYEAWNLKLGKRFFGYTPDHSEVKPEEPKQEPKRKPKKYKALDVAWLEGITALDLVKTSLELGGTSKELSRREAIGVLQVLHGAGLLHPEVAADYPEFLRPVDGGELRKRLSEWQEGK